MDIGQYQGAVVSSGVEAVILVRVNDVAQGRTLGQRTVVVELEDDGGCVDDAVASALREAPPADRWTAY